MSRPFRLLYLEHSEIIGGSSTSLKELLTDAIARGYECHVICKNQLLAGIYSELGATAHLAPVTPYDHNTSKFYRINPIDILRLGRLFLRMINSFIKIYPIVRSVKPNVVHLNSSVLIFYTIYFRMLGLANILHIRENIVKGYTGLRRSLIRWMANTFATYVIYISEHELYLLATRPEKSFVVYNYIHESSFVPVVPAGKAYVAGDELILVSLGGLFNLKGGRKILQALKGTDAKVKVLIVGTIDPRVYPDELRSVEGAQYTDEIIGLLNDPSVSERVELVGKVRDPATYIQRAHGLIFWAEAPHFPRTVFEAWILKKPVLYYNPLFKNAIINSDTVLNVKVGTPSSLLEGMINFPLSHTFQAEAIVHCYELARANFTEKNFTKIDDIYRRCIQREL